MGRQYINYALSARPVFYWKRKDDATINEITNLGKRK